MIQNISLMVILSSSVLAAGLSPSKLTMTTIKEQIFIVLTTSDGFLLLPFQS